MTANKKLPTPRNIAAEEELPYFSPSYHHPHLNEKLKNVPSEPGCYIMRDERRRVIYVGKSRCLFNRVNSYFQSPGHLSPRIQRMVSQIADFDTIVVTSEMEALVLENNLIKKYRPYFNVLMRDDKQYPMIEITGETYPRVRISRKANNKSSRYFGPYTDGPTLRSTKKILQKTFHLRSCKGNLEKGTDRPCLNYHIKLCTAPCCRKVSPEQYQLQADDAADFLSGRTSSVIRRLKAEMEREASLYNYERCAVIRDTLQDIDNIVRQQKVMLQTCDNEDYITLATQNSLTCVLVWQIREGKLVGQQDFILSSPLDKGNAEILEAFLGQYYSSAVVPPPLILTEELPESEAIPEWLGSLRGGKAVLRVPQRGTKRDILEMASRNAKEKLNQELLVPSKLEVRQKALEELKNALVLSRLPIRMECVDISNTQGKQPTGSLVVFEHGLPRRTHYRKFKIKGLDTPNDLAMMREVLERRFAHALGKETKPDESLDTLPDLLVVDGGKGQLSLAESVIRSLGLENKVQLAGLAKRLEEIFTPQMDESVLLEQNSEAYLLVTHLRNEAHRFAITFHRQLRAKTVTSSRLDEIPGVGAAKKKELLRHFSSFRRLMAADIEELAEAPGIGPKLAAIIHEYLHER